MKFPIGDKVKTRFGVIEVLFINDDDVIDESYLVGIKNYAGHSGKFLLSDEEVKKYVIKKGYKDQCKWIKRSYLEKIKYVEENNLKFEIHDLVKLKSVKENKLKFHIGDKVKTAHGIGEVLSVTNYDENLLYLVGIKGYDGHSGSFFLTEKEDEYIIKKGYDNQCEYFFEYELEKVEINKNIKNNQAFKFRIQEIVKTDLGLGIILNYRRGEFIVKLKEFKDNIFVFKEENLQELGEDEALFKIGDHVKTYQGVGEVLYVLPNPNIFNRYLIGIKMIDAHNGEDCLNYNEIEKYIIKKGYKNQCFWLNENSLEYIVENQ